MTIKPIAMRDAFLEEIWQAMQKDETIFFACADFGSPVLDKIRADFADRFVNVGIAEQNLINVATGLALEGYKVFAYAIAPFITMRCYEQVRVNLALLSKVRPLNVNLIGVGAGYSYVVSGPTHQCYEDITLMRALAGMKVLSPSDHVSAKALFKTCVEQTGPKYLRFDAQVLPVLYEDEKQAANQTYVERHTGQKICMIATGYMTQTAQKVRDVLAQQNIEVGLVDLFDLSQGSAAQLDSLLARYKAVVTLEEGFINCGGLDAHIGSHTAAHHPNLRLMHLGVTPNYHFELGTRSELHDSVGLGVDTIADKIKSLSASL
ncbi:MAG: transketolase C-terminal domain-containing protein [Alphaproteobacteria bacterium]|jgi:transketolase|nr:transketolase C-terminal domain-containing protein [Alphaproteobacteria bacterium]